MKRLVVQVVALLALAESTLGDGEGEVAPHRVCTVTLEEGQEMHREIAGLGMACLGASGSDLQLYDQSETLEDYKEFFRSYCGKQPQIRECLEEVVLTSRACQNDTRHRIYQVWHELLLTTLEAGCAQDGEMLANMFLSYEPTEDSDPLKDCLPTFGLRAQLITEMGVSDFSTIYILYREYVQAKECINSKTGLDQHLKSGIESLLSVMTENFKCIHPQDDSVLLCKNLDPKQDGSPRVCPIKSKDEKPLYDLLRDHFPFCVLPLTKEGEPKGLDSFEILEHYMRDECRKMPSINSCLREVSFLSSSCLDERQHLILSTAQDLMTNILGQVCVEDGRHLANVVFKIATNISQEHSDKLTRYTIVLRAVNEAYEEEVTSEKSLELYRIFKLSKGYLIDYLQGDDDAVSSAELVLNGVIENMKCLDRELTTSELCSTLDNTV